MTTFATTPYWLYWALVLSPALPYVVLNLSYRRILNRKIAEAAGRLTEETKLAYANAYGDPDIRTSLERFYHWTTYVAPLVLTSLVASTFAAAAFAMAALPLPGVPPDVVKQMSTTSAPVVAGALGAYLFGLDDLVKRHAAADLSSSALHTTWVRITITAGFGVILAATGIPNVVSVPLAFAVGSLPLGAIWALSRKRANVEAEEGKFWDPDLYLIEGLTLSARDRLIAEDIDSVQRLAFSDPVRLLFRTNIEWNVILDIIDQALLINYVREKVAALRCIGIRGAIEMAELSDRSAENGNTEAEIQHARRMMAIVAAILGSERDTAINLSYELANDPVVLYIWECYDATYTAAPSPADVVREPLMSWRRLATTSSGNGH